jgi:hypothetical protein
MQEMGTPKLPSHHHQPKISTPKIAHQNASPSTQPHEALGMAKQAFSNMTAGVANNVRAMQQQQQQAAPIHTGPTQMQVRQQQLHMQRLMQEHALGNRVKNTNMTMPQRQSANQAMLMYNQSVNQGRAQQNQQNAAALHAHNARVNQLAQQSQYFNAGQQRIQYYAQQLQQKQQDLQQAQLQSQQHPQFHHQKHTHQHNVNTASLSSIHPQVMGTASTAPGSGFPVQRPPSASPQQMPQYLQGNMSMNMMNMGMNMQGVGMGMNVHPNVAPSMTLNAPVPNNMTMNLPSGMQQNVSGMMLNMGNTVPNPTGQQNPSDPANPSSALYNPNAR